MSRSTRFSLSYEPADTSQPSIIFNELIDWIEAGYLEFYKPYTEVDAATYNVDEFDYILHVTYTATGTVAITIPTALVVEGRRLVIKDTSNAGTYNITVDGEGGELLDGEATQVISGDYDSMSLYSDGTNWFIF